MICTLPERFERLKRLMHVLKSQVEPYGDRIEIKTHDAGRSMPTGQKRNELIAMSSGDYFCFIDDDDMVTGNYVQSIMDAISSSPDVVTFCGWMTTNGQYPVDFKIGLNEKYEERNGMYYRYPNHLCVFRRAAIADVSFPHVWNMEDYQFATEIHSRRLCQLEVHIPEKIYHYQFSSKKPPYGTH